jgi:hypothetical protein
MGYSGSDWISPYTYRALLAKGDPQPSQPAAARRLSLMMASAAMPAAGVSGPSSGRVRAEWIKHRSPLLFLSIWVDRGKAILRPSFTYPAYVRRPGAPTGYEAHLEGAEGKLLACVGLQQACGACDQDCGPLHLQGEVPWDSAAQRLVLRHDGADVESWPVESAPKLDVKVAKSREAYRLTWSTASEEKPLSYLVQWQDMDGTWRGIAPRTSEPSMTLPFRYLFARRDVLRLRVLAVHLLHTASVELELKVAGIDPPSMIDVTYLPETDSYRAVARDPLGRALPADNLVWYGEDGGEIAQGSILLLRATTRQGVATARLNGAGVTAAVGFALLDPRPDDERHICGCRPSGSAAAKMLQRAGLVTYEKGN